MIRSNLKKLVLLKPEISFRSLYFKYIVCALVLIVLIVISSKKYELNSLHIYTEPKLDLCPITSKHLVGEFIPDLRETNLEQYDKQFENVFEPGGYYKPADCISRDRVAILVPVRKRDEEIPILLKNLHPFLMRQQLEYQIFVIHQAPGYLFNKGALFNVGYIEAMKVRKWDCFIFQDVDSIPINDRNLYNCPRTNPRHMGVLIDKFNFTLYYEEFFGVAYAMTDDQYQQINGNANSFWGWGGEDNDVSHRILNAGYGIDRYASNITKYVSLPQLIGSTYNPDWAKQIDEGYSHFTTDGLNSIKYHIKEIRQRNTFTSVLVDFVPEELGSDSKNVKETNPKFATENY